jgi:hypothetical protein
VWAKKIAILVGLVGKSRVRRAMPHALTFGTGIEVCWAINRIADASERFLRGPYLMQRLLGRNMRAP